MRKRRDAPWPAGRWKKHLADAVTEREELLALLGLGGHPPSSTPDAIRGFPLRVPRGFVSRIRRGDPEDPLLRQVLPVAAEDLSKPGFSADPLSELSGQPTDGVLHKYHGRNLFMVTGACAVHCRYCFRRHFPYEENSLHKADIERIVSGLSSEREISEVILSGGDPLMVSESRLAEISLALTRLKTLRRLRIHTRLPIVLPQRVDGPLVSWIQSLELPLVIVVHANHANEIDRDVRRALAVLGNTGATLLNQTVLLRGVNDSPQTLADLSEALFDAGVMPYYLHMLDPVAGAAHFDVPDDTAKQLYGELTARLPGYLVPKLVREIPGAPAKAGIDLWK